mmetsp:Transcript_5798/g.9015  ORF Transcript_5798/g.9015 Transcript_5798/m.9015 type:complete len:228 (-) Transcript_5798:809-1492(-)
MLISKVVWILGLEFAKSCKSKMEIWVDTRLLSPLLALTIMREKKTKRTFHKPNHMDRRIQTEGNKNARGVRVSRAGEGLFPGERRPPRQGQVFRCYKLDDEMCGDIIAIDTCMSNALCRRVAILRPCCFAFRILLNLSPKYCLVCSKFSETNVIPHKNAETGACLSVCSGVGPTTSTIVPWLGRKNACMNLLRSPSREFTSCFFFKVIPNFSKERIVSSTWFVIKTT